MKKPAVREQQPDLLGTPAAAPASKPVAKAEPKAKRTSSVAVVEAPAPKNMLGVIAGAAADSRVDVAKMQALLTMQREIEDRQEAREFNLALLAAQNEIPKIVKDRANEHTKSRYATLEKVSKEVDHISRRHGFTMSFGTDDSPLAGHYRIVCDLAHSGGHVRRYKIDLQGDAAGSQGKSNKTPIQGVGSTMSYGRRYLKVMMFDLIIVGEDQDGNRRAAKVQPPDDGGTVIEGESSTTVDVITRKQVDDLVDAIEACGVGRARFLQHYELAKVEDLPAKRFAEAMKACADFSERQKGGK